MERKRKNDDQLRHQIVELQEELLHHEIRIRSGLSDIVEPGRC